VTQNEALPAACEIINIQIHCEQDTELVTRASVVNADDAPVTCGDWSPVVLWICFISYCYYGSVLYLIMDLFYILLWLCFISYYGSILYLINVIMDLFYNNNNNAFHFYRTLPSKNLSATHIVKTNKTD